MEFQFKRESHKIYYVRACVVVLYSFSITAAEDGEQHSPLFVFFAVQKKEHFRN